MAKQYKTPGVYIQEQESIPNRIAQVETAIPVFIGYTALATKNGQSLHNTPTRIDGLLEYEQYFGGAPDVYYTLEASVAPYHFIPAERTKNFLLYNSLRIYFANGGGPCYIVSVGTFEDTIEKGEKDLGTGLLGALKPLQEEQAPTLVVIPDAVNLPSNQDCYDVYNEVLLHCEEMQYRMGILDVYDGYQARTLQPDDDVIIAFRNKVQQALRFGAAYYPWLNTNVVPDRAVDFSNINPADRTAIYTMLEQEAEARLSDPAEASKLAIIQDAINTLRGATTDFDTLPGQVDPHADAAEDNHETAHQTLLIASPLYKALMAGIKQAMNLLPPAAAMAGVYARTDSERGVFQSPANTGIVSAISPAVEITDAEQQDLNTPLNGKAINAIRTFLGQGLLVWGARTLDGNNQDWRYIAVRRTIMMFEQSIKLALEGLVFEPNTGPTWEAAKSMITNFLTLQWQSGALVGPIPSEAFGVQVGLGSTMTTNDILEGYMIVQITVALSRPAEFIVLQIRQKMVSG